ncbi:hypothetical protein Glove_216g157 [Diversispora epigaea]|uniref:Uncharacterized protein n=1 Tax=Diversispora epigaea TaxID=1348612 RepID=A0A397IGZ4_9GLOM|nr:hypothetical protein Glove_216g157 [Diversispora epigaea]
MIYSLDKLTKKFNYLSYTLPILVKQYEEFLYLDIYIIKSILSHLSTKIDRIVKNTTKNHITFIRYFSCERIISMKMDSQTIDYRADRIMKLFEKSKQIPLFVLEVFSEPNNSDPDK